MQVYIKDILHSRIIKHCEKLFIDGHYSQAAFEAMKQVELTLKEKSGETKKYGVNLITSLFGKGDNIKLRVPFGDELQEKAKILFEGAFSYYRNYSVHDGSKINNVISFRIMIIASELLDLLGASSISFADIDGLNGLVKKGVFKNEGNVIDLLILLDGEYILNNTADGLAEKLANKGFSQEQMQALIEVGLLEYQSQKYIPSLDELNNDEFKPEEIGFFKLTYLGKNLINKN
ncbi:MAG: TIGR02391 family protein [Ignavibacteriaceae bacterium]